MNRVERQGFFAKPLIEFAIVKVTVILMST